MLGAIGSALKGGALSGIIKNGVKSLLSGGKNPLLNLLKNFLSQQNQGAAAKFLNTTLNSLVDGQANHGAAKPAVNFVKNAL